MEVLRLFIFVVIIAFLVELMYCLYRMDKGEHGCHQPTDNNLDDSNPPQEVGK